MRLLTAIGLLLLSACTDATTPSDEPSGETPGAVTDDTSNPTTTLPEATPAPADLFFISGSHGPGGDIPFIRVALNEGAPFAPTLGSPNGSPDTDAPPISARQLEAGSHTLTLYYDVLASAEEPPAASSLLRQESFSVDADHDSWCSPHATTSAAMTLMWPGG